MRVDFLRRQWNRIPGSTPGSRWRRAFSYYAMFLSLVMLVDPVGAASGRGYLVGTIVSVSVLAGSAFFFAQSVLPGSGNEHAAEYHDRPENKND